MELRKHHLGLAVGCVLLIAGATMAQTPINSLPFSINNPGSYVLAADLSGVDGIIINSPHVSLDLGGHALTGLAGSHDGIWVRGPRADIEVYNGTIAGWRGNGIQADDGLNSKYHDLRLSGNYDCGLRAGKGAVIENVEAQHNSGAGLMGSDSIVIAHSATTGNGGFGAMVGRGSVINGLTCVKNAGGGILADDGSLITGNAVADNGYSLTGVPQVEASGPCLAGTMAGIAVIGEGTHVADNVLTGNGIGLQLLAPRNSVARNVVKGSHPNYDIVAGNELDILLSELPETILWPAKVTLLGSLSGVPGQHGIVIAADGVTVDLAGQTLLGVPGSLDGIHVLDFPTDVEKHSDLAVMNGGVEHWGGSGIMALKANNVRVKDLLVEENAEFGLRAGYGARVVDSSFLKNGDDGVRTGQDSLVQGVTSNLNGADGFDILDDTLIVNSVASENTLYGIRTADGAQVRSCTASHNGLGIAVSRGATVADCTVSYNASVGIRTSDHGYVLGNTCHANESGIVVLSGAGTRVDGNNVTHNAFAGINCIGTGNLMIRNSAQGNGSDYMWSNPNAYGTIQDVSGGSFTLTDPWANLRF